jgi:hypothetical protein
MRINAARRAPLITMKKTQSLSLIGLTLSISSILAANPGIPERQSSGRYDQITEDWPFSIETPRAPAAVNPEGPFANFHVSGIGITYENGEEQVFVAISSKDKQVSFSLFGSEKGHDDIYVERVEWNDNVGKGRVTLKKGNETGTIGFDEMAIRTPAPAAANPTRPAGDRMVHPRPLNPNSAIPKLPRRTPGANPPAQPNQGTDPAPAQRVRVIR